MVTKMIIFLILIRNSPFTFYQSMRFLNISILIPSFPESPFKIKRTPFLKTILSRL